MRVKVEIPAMIVIGENGDVEIDAGRDRKFGLPVSDGIDAQDVANILRRLPYWLLKVWDDDNTEQADKIKDSLKRSEERNR